jgi:hypothetical protein
MGRKALDGMLAEIRQLREETMRELIDLTEGEFPLPTDMERWTSVRRVLLRFGDHMREHSNQIAGVRAAIGRGPTMPQRMLAEAEMAWGVLLGMTVGLTDDDLEEKPPDGGWSVQEVLQHVASVERGYLNGIREARADHAS